MVEKVVGNQAKNKVLKGSSLKTPVANVDMVNFISSQFQASTDQLNYLTGDVLTKEEEWVKLSKDIKAKPVVMQFIRPLEDKT